MDQMMVTELEKPQWIQDLISIFEEEIESYENLLRIEKEKKEAILTANGKRIESLSNESIVYIRKAQLDEKSRMELIHRIYTEESGQQPDSNLTLSEFLNYSDRKLNFVLKEYSTKLKSIVQSLRESIIINEKLLQTRNGLIQQTISGIKNMKEDSEVTYNSNKASKNNGNNRSSLFLNARA
jgi:hypothetical protein